MSTTFFIPAVNMMGIGSLDEAIAALRQYPFRRALIVTDAGLAKAGVAGKVSKLLAQQDIQSVIFDGAKPNPTVGNVEAGLALLRQHQCDFVISLGGGAATSAPNAANTRSQQSFFISIPSSNKNSYLLLNI